MPLGDSITRGLRGNSNENLEYQFECGDSIQSTWIDTTREHFINDREKYQAHIEIVSGASNGLYTLTLIINPAGAGIVKKNPDKETYDQDEVVQLRAIPNDNYQFEHWDGVGGANAKNPINIYMRRDRAITANFTGEGLPVYKGYRKYLFDLLVNYGINFDFVGSLSDGDPSTFDTDHEGHAGWRAQQIDANINIWLNNSYPDIVLLHIGTNDIGYRESNESTIIEIESIIDKIYNYNSETVILLCSIIRTAAWEWGYLKTEELNVLIKQLYNKKYNEGYNIYYVAQNEAFKSNVNWQQDYMADGVHPNENGYNIMALTFFNVLTNILNPASYSISGNIFYYANNNQINNVIINLSDGYASSFITKLDGFYEFRNLSENKNYSVLPAKNKLYRTENTAITMYDAALALRHAVGVETLSSKSQMAADVDKDGQVLAFDAALIARYVVELAQLDNDHVGEWIFSPAIRSYKNLLSNQQRQNFIGILLGDVNGAWAQNKLNRSQKSEFDWITCINSEAADIISIPVRIFEDSLLSVDIVMEYPPDILEFVSITKSYPDDGIKLFFNVHNNKIKVGTYSASHLSIEGEFLNINFKIKDMARDCSTILSLDRLQINNYSIENTIAELNVLGNEHRKNAIKVADNYPNPFNPTTIIPFEITEQGNVTINIFNMLGQYIGTLLNEEKNPGSYKIIWDGHNKDGIEVANGIYIYRVAFKNQFINKTMLKLE